MYYVLTIAKRKNAKRHIAGKFDSLDEAFKFAENNINSKYRVQITDGRWNVIHSWA